MKTCVQFLAALKAHLEVDTDVALAAALGITKVAVHKIQKKKSLFGEQTADKVALLLGEDADYVRECVYAERISMKAKRAKDGRTRRAWENVAKKLAAGAGALFVAIGLGALSQSADAVRAAPGAWNLSLCKIRRPWLARCAQALRSALDRTLGTFPGALGAL